MTTDFQTIDLRLDGRSAVIEFRRPARLNALNRQMLLEILSALDVVRRSRMNVLTFTGEGSAFLAGVDLDSPYFMEDTSGDSIFEGKVLLDEQHEMIQGIFDLPCVTIAKINGDTVGGGGFGLAMACDMRFAVHDARFWLVPGQLSVVQDFGLSWFLQRAIGMPRTFELAFTGRRVNAEVGVAWGFVNECFDELASLDERVGEVAAQIAEIGTDAVHMLKHVIRSGATSTLDAQLKTEAIANGLAFQSVEFAIAKERLLRHLGKRK